MQDEFYTLSLAEKESDICVNNFIKKLPNRLYKKYLMKKLPLKIEEISYMDEKGQNLILPFTETTIKELDSEFVKTFISNIFLKYDITTVYCSDFLKKYIQQENTSYQSLLKYLVLDQIVTKLLTDNNLEWKNTKLVIIDSGDNRMDYLLELFVGNLNYLTIITKREEYFDEIKEIIYENTGLVIEITENPTKEKINGNIIIDANKELCKSCSYFDNNAIIVDLESCTSKMQYLYSRRKDLQVIYDVILSARDYEVDNDLLGYILCAKNFVCSNFVKNGSRSHRVKDLLEITKYYNIRLKHLKIIERN